MTIHSKVIASVKDSGPDFKLVEIQPIDQLSARIVLQARHTDYSASQWREAVAKFFGGKARLVQGSIVQLPSTWNEVSSVGAHVIANALSKAFNDDTVKGMRVVKANMFMDESDNAWKVIGEGDSKRLVCLKQENFEDILNAKKSRSGGYRLSACAQNVASVVNSGDYVSYFNTLTQKVNCGFAFTAGNSIKVFDRLAGQAVEIKPQQVVAFSTVDINDFERPVVASLDFGAIKEHLDYMRILYGKEPEYFRELEKLLLGQ